MVAASHVTGRADHRFGLDLDKPGWVEQRAHHNHGMRRAEVGEPGAVAARDGLDDVDAARGLYLVVAPQRHHGQ